MSGEARSGGDRSYRLEPLDTSGVFLGLGVVQCVLLAGGLATAVIAVSAGLPLPAAVVPVIAAGVASFARAGGHPVWEWLPLGVDLAVGRVGSPTTLGGAVAVVAERHGPAAAATTVPGGPGGGRDPAPPPRRSAAAVRDRERHTLTAVVPVRGGSFVIEPRAEQDRLLAAWGDVLGQFATERGMVAHLCWSDLAATLGCGPPRSLASAGAGERDATHPAAERSLHGAARRGGCVGHGP